MYTHTHTHTHRHTHRHTHKHTHTHTRHTHTYIHTYILSRSVASKNADSVAAPEWRERVTKYEDDDRGSEKEEGRGSEQRAYDEYVEWNNRLQAGLQSQSSYESGVTSVSSQLESRPAQGVRH
jgi:hypothetical protein